MTSQGKLEAALIAKSLLEILAAVCAMYSTSLQSPAVSRLEGELGIREIPRPKDDLRLPCDLCPKPARARGVLIHGIRWNLCQECFARENSPSRIPGPPRLVREAL